MFSLEAADLTESGFISSVIIRPIWLSIKVYFECFRLRLHCKRNKLVRELEEMVRLASTLHTQLKRSVLLFVTESSFLFEVFSVIWDEQTHTQDDQ